MKKILSLILSLAMIATLCVSMNITAHAATVPAFSGGDGTAASPYLISTKADLIALSDYITNATDTELAAVDAVDSCGLGSFHGYYFEMTADIDMTGVAWKPIMTFCGNFEGNSHTISNLTSGEASYFENAEQTLSSYNVGLFCQLINATVNNLAIDKSTFISATTTDATGIRDVYVGGIASTAIASVINNCVITNSTFALNRVGKNLSYLGGIAAYSDISYISNCAVKSSTMATGTTGNIYVGGITGCVGDIYYEYKDTYNMTVGDGSSYGVANCLCNADLSQAVANAGTVMGGVIGWAQNDFVAEKIDGCSFDGSITNAGRAGGIVGECSILTNAIEIKNCTVHATLSGSPVADIAVIGTGNESKVTLTNNTVKDPTIDTITSIATGSNSAAAIIKGTYAAGQTAETVYSVDIAWGSMEFIYTDASKGTWNPAKITYEGATEAGWSCATDANKITVTNKSNAAIDAALSFAKIDTSNITADFYDATTGGTAIAGSKLSLASAAPLAGENTGEAKIGTAYLQITGGTLASGTSSAKIGTVTVTINNQ